MDYKNLMKIFVGKTSNNKTDWRSGILNHSNPFHHDNSFMISPSTPKIYEISAARIHIPQRS